MPKVLGFILGKILKKKLEKTTVAQGLGRLPQSVLIEETAQLLQDLSLILGDSSFFYSENPSAADFSVYGQIGFGLSGTTPAFEKEYAKHANLQEFYQRVKILLTKKSA
jgi:glutathione S-transferase